MTSSFPARDGGRVVVDCLRIHGVDAVFCVAGESYLPVLDALYDARNSIRVISCRQEGAACHMAEAYGKLTGRPGICLASRGPGAMNASIGVHTAQQDSTPLILLIGQVPRETLDREGLQEIDYRRVFSGMTKWTAQIEDARRIPEMLSRAFQVATSGRPGPVVLSLPEDVLDEVVSVPDPAPFQPIRSHPGEGQIEALRAMLGGARRPLLILGGGAWSLEASRDTIAFAEANNLPAAVAFRRHHLFDNRRRNYVGDIGLGTIPSLVERVRTADLLIVVGAELGEVVTGRYRYLRVPKPAQTLVHVHPGPEELGKIYQPDLAINAGVAEFARAARRMPPVPSAAWDAWVAAARKDYEAALIPAREPGDVNLGEVVAWLNRRLPEDAVVTNGGGTYTLWLLRHYQFKAYLSQLSPASGSMGYGLPAALAAKVVFPERLAVAFAGDGCFLMTAQEMATAMQFMLPVIVVVVNNGSLGSIRLHQERRYPHRVVATDLVNPDFAAFARSFGAHGETVMRTAEFPAAFERCVASGRPSVIELRTALEAAGPDRRLSGERGMQRRKRPGLASE